MHGNDEVDDIHVLRSRLAEYERLWRAASPRLEAFARLERLAEAQASTPEAVARRATVARAEARIVELRAETDALEATIGQLGTEVHRLDDERAEAMRRLGDVERQLGFVDGELQRRTADRQAVERELSSLLALRDQRSQEVAELTQSRDDLYVEVAELLEGIEDIHGSGGFAGANQLAAVLPAGSAGGKITAEQFGEDSDLAGFDEFFNADIGHDKSRDWILGDAGSTSPI